MYTELPPNNTHLLSLQPPRMLHLFLLSLLLLALLFQGQFQPPSPIIQMYSFIISLLYSAAYFMYIVLYSCIFYLYFRVFINYICTMKRLQPPAITISDYLYFIGLHYTHCCVLYNIYYLYCLKSYLASL